MAGTRKIILHCHSVTTGCLLHPLSFSSHSYATTMVRPGHVGEDQTMLLTVSVVAYHFYALS